MKEVLTGAALPACQCEDGVGVGVGGGGGGGGGGGRDRRRPLGDCHAHHAGQEAGPHFHSTEKQ